MSNEKKLTALVFCPGRAVIKYRKIQIKKVNQFQAWISRNVPGVDHINYYDHDTKEFVEQIKLGK